jgi:hypothetical protein
LVSPNNLERKETMRKRACERKKPRKTNLVKDKECKKDLVKEKDSKRAKVQ